MGITPFRSEARHERRNQRVCDSDRRRAARDSSFSSVVRCPLHHDFAHPQCPKKYFNGIDNDSRGSSGHQFAPGGRAHWHPPQSRTHILYSIVIRRTSCFYPIAMQASMIQSSSTLSTIYRASLNTQSTRWSLPSPGAPPKPLRELRHDRMIL